MNPQNAGTLKELLSNFSHRGTESSTEADSPPSSASSPVRMAAGTRANTDPDPLDKLMKKNKAWSQARLLEDSQYFHSLLSQQAPEYFWIGCSDSRVPANMILGLEPGEVFVQRNVGNQATHTDLNGMSCLEYAVKELKVRNVLLCGHYGCGAIKAALKLPSKTQNLVNCWISDIRECRNMHRAELMALPNLEAQTDRLCELNVLRQTFNVCTTHVVQSAWDKGQELNIYGVAYSLKDGLIKRLCGPISKNGDFIHDQAMFAERGSSYVGFMETPEGDRGGVERPSVCMSFKSRMEAFHAYMNTVQVNNRIAEHIGWSDVIGTSAAADVIGTSAAADAANKAAEAAAAAAAGAATATKAHAAAPAAASTATPATPAPASADECGTR